MLANLIGNALDAYEEANRPDRRLVIETHRDGRAVTLSVRDWAGGVPDAVLPHIFDELYTTKQIGRGTGLGLWISRNLIEQNFGGTLTVETAPNVGSRFVVTLTAVDGPSTASTAERAA